MSSDRCVNCMEEAEERYELLLRSTRHESVPLCPECRAAIEAETGESLTPE
jgi:NAD-dependent SIR2 family protein deacetylase